MASFKEPASIIFIALGLADITLEANSFIFSLTAQEHSEIKKVSYLSSTWKNSIGYSDYKDVVEKNKFTSDSSLISGLTNSVSVGTINETSTEVYVENEWVEDVKAYWGDNKSNIVINGRNMLDVFRERIGEVKEWVHRKVAGMGR